MIQTHVYICRRYHVLLPQCWVLPLLLGVCWKPTSKHGPPQALSRVRKHVCYGKGWQLPRNPASPSQVTSRQHILIVWMNNRNASSLSLFWTASIVFIKWEWVQQPWFTIDIVSIKSGGNQLKLKKEFQIPLMYKNISIGVRMYP